MKNSGPQSSYSTAKTLLKGLCLVVLFQAGIGNGLAQVISTIAGTGPFGYSEDGTQATAATFQKISGITIDKDNCVIFADHHNHLIRKITHVGKIITIAGCGKHGCSGDNGAATQACLNRPMGIMADKRGSVFISDALNNRIRKVDAAGIITTVAGGGTSYPGDGGPATMASIDKPNGIFVDDSGYMYIPDQNSRVRKVDRAGIITTIAGTGVVGYSGDGGPATDAKFGLVNAVIKDRAGNIYVSDWNNQVLRKIDTHGIITTVAGTAGLVGFSGDNGPATNASVRGLAEPILDKEGNIYFSDPDNNRVRKIDKNGIISTYAGDCNPLSAGDGNHPALASLDWPGQLCFDSSGNLYIAEVHGNRIRKVNIREHPKLMPNEEKEQNGKIFWIVTTLFLLALIAFAIVITQKIVSSRNTMRNLQRQLELKSVYAQINPHFIFNSLTTVQYFIKKKNNTEASEHLTKFFTLLGAYIKSSRSKYISIAEEVDNLNPNIGFATQLKK